MSKSIPWRELGLLSAGLALVAVVHLLDWVVLDAMPYDKGSYDPHKKVPDWQVVLRTPGYLPLWWFLAFTFWLAMAERSQRMLWRGRLWCLAATPTVAVLIAEFLKMTVRRRRPRDTQRYLASIDSQGKELSDPGLAPDELPLYDFKPWDGEIGSRGMAFPSSHAIVAFTGAAVLSAIWPRATALWWLLALGTGLSRISGHAHFPSDVAMAAVVAYFLVRWTRPRFFEREGLSPAP